MLNRVSRRRQLALLIFLCIAVMISRPVARDSNAQEDPTAQPDLAGIVLSPFDSGLTEFRHAGAFDESLNDEARVAAAYRGSPDEEDVYASLLSAAGFVRKHISTLQLNNAGDPRQIEQIVRSYVSYFHTAEGARTAFAALEDESAVSTAEDLAPASPIGEEADLTTEGGFDDESRPFRSLDLTFRISNLIGGVTLIVYPSATGFEPDPAQVEALGAILAARMLDLPAPSIGVSIARLDPAEIVTFDDTYYRTSGRDVPLVDESEEATALRTMAYGDAETVYQLFQGIDGAGALGVLYSLTLYDFNSAEQATAWMDDSKELISGNDYYSNIASAAPGDINSERTLSYTFGPFGAPPKAGISLAQIGAIIVRVQIVPNGALPEVPANILEELTNSQISCLELKNCVSIAVPQSLIDYISTPVAVPVASPDASPSSSS